MRCSLIADFSPNVKPPAVGTQMRCSITNSDWPFCVQKMIFTPGLTFSLYNPVDVAGQHVLTTLLSPRREKGGPAHRRQDPCGKISLLSRNYYDTHVASNTSIFNSVTFPEDIKPFGHVLRRLSLIAGFVETATYQTAALGSKTSLIFSMRISLNLTPRTFPNGSTGWNVRETILFTCFGQDDQDYYAYHD